MNKIKNLVQVIKKIWGPFLLVCLSLAVVLNIVCQFIDFTDPGTTGYKIWEGCQDRNATNEIDDCMLLNSSFVISIVFGIVFTVFAGLFLFPFKGIGSMTTKVFGGVTLFSGIIFMIFQIMSTVLVAQQIEGRPRTRKDVVGWELLMIATIISCVAIVFNPVTVNYSVFFAKNFAETFQDAAKKTNSGIYQPISQSGRFAVTKSDMVRGLF